jgi:4-carboxymuconolactone decarboxylase
VTPRLAKFAPADLDDDQRALYDVIAGGPRASGPQLFALKDPDGGLEGPFNAMLLRPSIGAALQSVGSAVRYGGALSDRAREIAILVVAYAWDSGFEIHAHEAVGRSVGLTDDDLRAVRSGDVSGLPAEERLVAQTAARLTAGGDLDDDDFAAARDHLGLAVLFELTTVVGYYATLALQLRVFRVTAAS